MRVISLGLRDESLAMRRLRRYASAPRKEQFDEHACDICGTVWMWNTYNYPVQEPRRCERCRPDEHWQTGGVSREVANQVFNRGARR